jgi:predicted nucleic acid-binding protein
VYLLDTSVVSEARKGSLANPGVLRFLTEVRREHQPLFLSTILVGEIRQAVERIRLRGENAQASALERWLEKFSAKYESQILAFDSEAAMVWGVLCAVDSARPIDKQVAAIALVHDLTLVTANEAAFASTGVRLHDPFMKPS